jgi:hypothetical protein
VRVDLSVLAFSVVLAGGWTALRLGAGHTLFCGHTFAEAAGSSKRTGSGSHRSLRRLISSQIALTLVLLTVAVGAIAGFRRLAVLDDCQIALSFESAAHILLSCFM